MKKTTRLKLGEISLRIKNITCSRTFARGLKPTPSPVGDSIPRRLNAKGGDYCSKPHVNADKAGNSYTIKIFLALIIVSLPLSLSACKEQSNFLEYAPPVPRDPSEGPFKLARAKDDIITYKKFIHNHPNSKYLPAAISRMGELLVIEGKKESLEAYVKTFPKYKHKVSSALNEITLIEKLNEQMNETDELKFNNTKLKIRRGELFYAHNYFKAFTKLEDAMGLDAEYDIRIDTIHAPDFIKVVLMPGVSFAMEESFHALSNARYKIMVAESAPLGKYRVEITFGAYRKEEGNWVWRDGSGIIHEIEVIDNAVTDPVDLLIAFRGVSYFAEKEAEAKQRRNLLRPPTNTTEFGKHYMYTYDLADLTVLAEKYRTYRGISRHHLEMASQSEDPAISQQARAYLQQLGPAPNGVNFIPFTIK